MGKTLSSAVCRAAVVVGLGLSLVLSASVASAEGSEKDEGGGKLKAWTLRIHYQRTSGEYGTWGVYAWKGPQLGAPKWPANWKFNARDAYGVYYDVALGEGANVVEFLLTDGRGNKGCSKDQKYVLPAEVATKGAEIWLRDSDCAIHSAPLKK
jgi:hypothetical protein